uniref:Orf66 n=1 Tax=Ancoracysta twista TaxID=2044563 RepID=A0A2H4R8F9_9EUKA|nr:orf66 [Ancoracysta twista]ATY40934.1 orf66 [Ancoracysta twista]
MSISETPVLVCLLYNRLLQWRVKANEWLKVYKFLMYPFNFRRYLLFISLWAHAMFLVTLLAYLDSL